jgi:polar amino acid transport system substrate-binding protein
MFLEGDTLVGIQPDIALALSEVMGLKFNNISVGSFDSLIPGVVSGRYDISTADFGVTRDRLEQVDFVTEFAMGTGFAVKTGTDIAIDEASDLCGHSVGVLAGSYFIDQVKAINDQCVSAGNHELDVQTYPNDGARTLALTNGRVEVTAAAVDALGYQVESGSVPIDMQDFQYEQVEQAVVLPNGSDLGPALQAAMKEIVENGTYLKILQKWGVQDLAYQSPDEVQLLTEPNQAP